MLISYNLLKSYFEKLIPEPEKIAELFTFHSFEVEAIFSPSPLPEGGLKGVGEKKEIKDTILDLKILPDRAHYCLCHKGIARELHAITGIPLKEHKYLDLQISETKPLSVKIEDSKLCRRYIGRRIENVKAGNSPKWLAEYVQVLGGRSINNIVDATNFIMQDVGQPLHAFDADKVVGGIAVRLAKSGERITTLDGKGVELDEKCLVIADEAGPLAIAGIKGGNRAEVTEETKNIILESANFHPAETRKTSRRINILTDASKRFENEISPELAGEAMVKLTELISQIGGEGLKIGNIVDIYPTSAEWKKPKVIEVSLKEISEILGVEIPEKEATDILERLGLETSDVLLGLGHRMSLSVKIPHERLDLNITEDIAEEIGRIRGYEFVPQKVADLTQTNADKKTKNNEFEVEKSVKVILAGLGFSEMYGYSFRNKGDIELANPLASDKGFLRTSLAEEMKEKLQSNLQFNLFDKEPVKLFEIGNIFSEEGEFTHLAIGSAYKTKKLNKSKEDTSGAIMKVLENFGMEEKFAHGFLAKAHYTDTFSIIEYNFNKLIEKLKKTQDIVKLNWELFRAGDKKYQKISAFPRVVRDIAFFAPIETIPQDAVKIIKESANTDLLIIGPILFDVFEKDGKKSMAFRMVFQSHEKTLSDDEVNNIMEKIYKAITEKGWKVR